MLNNCEELNTEIGGLNGDMQVVAEMVSQCIKENASTDAAQDEYLRKYSRLVKRHEKAVARLTECAAEHDRWNNRNRELRIFISALKKQPLIVEEWDDELWITFPDTGTVHRDGSIVFRFRNGVNIGISVG